MSTSSRKEPLSRKDKIKLLNDLIQGKTTINEQFPGQERIFIKRDENDFFRELNTGKQYFVKNKGELQCLFLKDTISVINIKRIIVSKT
ncbi:MAG: hypothetical protein JNL49_05965 [Bacteroidia bacterium]|nr:hypothetical protein [Bacteroidia bacterium]